MDINYELLEETREEIKNMRFFNEAVNINEEEYEIIHDYDEAYENAFHREYRYGELKGEPWSGIVEENMAELWGIIYQHENYAELSDIVSHIEIPELDDIEFTIKDYDAIDEICSEIEACVQSRFVYGKENAFFESMFKAYKLGGWPCGWNNGKIIVYTPDNK